MQSKLLVASTIIAALVIPGVVVANAKGKTKRNVDHNALVRKHIKNNRSYKLIVPKDRKVRAVHLVTDSGKLLSIPIDAIRLGGGATSAQGLNNQCGSNQELWTKWVKVTRCCSEDQNGNCTATQECKMDVSTCVNRDGSGTYTASGVPYSCIPEACGGSNSALQTLTPTGF